MMKDGIYLTASDKQKLLVAFERLLKSDCKRGHFTKSLYRHLNLNFGFIAHFDQDGFFANRFADPEGRMRTLDRIINASSYCFNDINTSDCGDLNTAIKEISLRYFNQMEQTAKLELKAKINQEIRSLQVRLESLS